jgi:hypothetical protein
MPVPSHAHPARNNIVWPVSIVLLGVFMIVLLLVSPPRTPLAQEDTPTETPTATETATVTNTSTPSPYPSDTPTATEFVYPYPVQTASAQAKTDTALAQRTDTPAPEAPEPETAPPRVSNQNQQEATPTFTSEPNTPTDTDVPEQRATNTPDNVTPTVTNTATNTPEANNLTCPSGETTLIEGIGPPNTALILFFEERPIIGTVVPKRPVGGTTSDTNGFYSIPLKVRTGKIGEFLVRVETRDRNILVRELICNVPQPTPGL